jgi:RNA polymerase sigma factor (sigma-70 family)
MSRVLDALALAGEQAAEEDVLAEGPFPDEPASHQWSHPVLATYIREVSREPLLTREEELLLFTTIREVRESVRSIFTGIEHRLPKAERRHIHAKTLRYEELARLWEELPGDVRAELSREQIAAMRRALLTWASARERLAQSNLRLVIYTVKRFRNDPTFFLDLIQEGNIGLLRAIDRYDPGRSSRFCTYALWWIWQAANRAYAKNAYTVRIPSYKVQQLGRYHRTRRVLQADSEARATDDEVAAAVGLSAKEVQHVTDIQARSVSLDDLSGEEMVSLSEFLTSGEDSPEAEVLQQDIADDLRCALDTLPVREAQVLRWRYGVESDVYTLQEIGARLSVSRERVRQLEQQAIRHLLQSDQAERLAEYSTP